MSVDATRRGLTPEERYQLRCQAKELLNGLTMTQILPDIQSSSSSSSEPSNRSWLRGTSNNNNNSSSSDRCRFFHKYGFLRVEGFADASEVLQLKQQMSDLCDDSWDPVQQNNNNNNNNNTIMAFATDAKSNELQGSNDYFLESACRVHFFAESHAMDPNNPQQLKPEFLLKPTTTSTSNNDKQQQQHIHKSKKLEALNKAGHGLHMIPGPFQTYATSDKVKELVAELGWRDPVIPQSMYICKNANIGGTVYSHQDSTFLFTEPYQSCLGLWLALDDATLDNGCLWVRPQSHWEVVRRQFVRNVVHFGTDAIEAQTNVGHGDLNAPKMIFQHLQDDPLPISWEGGLPVGSEPPCQGLLDAGFIPIECKAGDVLAFPGTLDHLSLPNFSNSQRHTFQLHLVEGPAEGITWSKSNWLQYPKGVDFLSIKI